MAEDTTRTNPVSLQGSILWAENGALAREMGKAEYSSRVHGTGLGPLLVRPISCSSTSASRLSQQESVFNTRMNSMMAKWEEKRIKTDERIAGQDQVIANMQKMIESLAAANAALVGNTSATQDTVSPNVLRARSSIASRSG
jgi:hypothetical protein